MKSINKRKCKLGGDFRIYLNKSSISYRADKKTSRRFFRQKVATPKHSIAPIDNNHYDTQNISNNVTSKTVSSGLESLISSTSRVLRLKQFASIGFRITFLASIVYPYFTMFSVFFALMWLFVRLTARINLYYDADEEQQKLVDSRMAPVIQITNCKKVWRIVQTSKVINRKYAAGVSNTVHRITCKASTRVPFPFKTNTRIASFKSKKETLLFLPDKLFIIQGSKIGALNYNEISIQYHTTRFLEDEAIPRDAQVVGQTWKYSNVSGGPDRRFKNNKTFPLCRYGELVLTSTSGLNTVIMYSNPNH